MTMQGLSHDYGKTRAHVLHAELQREVLDGKLKQIVGGQRRSATRLERILLTLIYIATALLTLLLSCAAYVLLR